MQNLPTYLICIICLLLGYLLGQLQFAVIFSRLLHHDDVRRHGSGNAGSTNMLRVFGLRSGILTFVGDFAKGLASVLIGRALGGSIGGCAMALGTILGHDFPVFFRFKGGKGVASTLGVSWALNPLFGAIITFLGVGTAIVTKIVSLGSMAGGVLFLVFTLLSGADIYQKLLAVILSALLILRHLENIRRIAAGTEIKISLSSIKK